MKRYHEEKHIIENRAKLYKELARTISPMLQTAEYLPIQGRFRKSLRCAGCGKARCQLCHSEKFPKRKPTRKEEQADNDLKE